MMLLILCLDCRHFLLIETLSGTLVLGWVNSQLARILNWVDRVIQKERWVLVSPQQRHGSSIVEVYRIVEETVDQFFALEVPMRPGELGSLFRGIDNAFQVYAKTVLDKIANMEAIVPSVPILTRYSRESGIKAFVKKELKDTRIPDVLKSVEGNINALCAVENSLHTVNQFFALEVPTRPGELGSLFRGIDNGFQVYAKTILDKIANKEDIVPPVPILMRYSRESGIKAFVKKELKDTRIPDFLKSVEIDVEATSTLCVQLNSLHAMESATISDKEQVQVN